MKTKSIDLEIIGFPGYYDSILFSWDDVIDTILYDLSLDFPIDQTKHGESIADLVIKHFNKKEYKNDVNEQYAKIYLAYFSEFKSITPMGKTEMQRLREYNFTTDRIFQKITISMEELQKLHEMILKDSNFEIFLKDAFSSRPGFISFYSDNINDWKDLDDLDDLQLSYLFYFYTYTVRGLDYEKSKDDMYDPLYYEIYDELDYHPDRNYLDTKFNDELEKLINTNFDSTDKITYELCPHCNTEVELPAKLQYQTCPSCNSKIKPCSLCDNDKVECNNCPIGPDITN